MRKFTYWGSSNIHLLLLVETSISHKAVSQSHYTFVSLATTTSLSLGRQSMGNRFARLNWIFHIQDCLLQLIQNERRLFWKSKPLSWACTFLQASTCSPNPCFNCSTRSWISANFLFASTNFYLVSQVLVKCGLCVKPCLYGDKCWGAKRAISFLVCTFHGDKWATCKEKEGQCKAR